MPAPLQPIPAVIDRFLAALTDADRELFLDVIENASSPVEIWTLATVLGYVGGFGELIAWSDSVAPRTDRRGVLSKQADDLARDIASARVHIDALTVDPDKGFQRIALLSKELRGHLIEVDKMSRAMDRKGLVLAGAERVMRELRGIFRGQAEMEEALTQAFKTVWAVLAEEN